MGLYYVVWDSCGYRLFESDTEEEEGEVDSKTDEESVPKKKSALQVRNIQVKQNRNTTHNLFYPEISFTLPSQLAYEAWVAGSKAALKSHKREEVQLKREENRIKKELCEEQGKASQTHIQCNFHIYIFLNDF